MILVKKFVSLEGELMYNFRNRVKKDIENRFSDLASSKADLSNLAYFLRRFLIFTSSWISYFPEFECKTIIGLIIGLVAPTVITLNNRIKELITVGEPDFVGKAQSLDEFFNKMTSEGDINKIKEFIASFVDEIITYTKNIEKSIDPLYDNQTIVTLKYVRYNFLQIHNILQDRGWTDTKKIPSLGDLDGYASKWNGTLLIPKLLDNPARPANLKKVEECILDVPPSELLKNAKSMEKLLHFLYSEIEICAAEICARNIAEFGCSMPLEFTVDMARQCYDEVRHAITVSEYMDVYGVKLGDYTYTNKSWIQYLKGENLAEKLAIEQIIAEGNGLDVSDVILKILKNKKHLENFHKLYEFLLADETMHCRYGNKWLNYLVKDDEKEYESIIDKAISKTDLNIPGGAPVYIEARRAANYKEPFIQNRLLREKNHIDDSIDMASKNGTVKLTRKG